MIKILSLQSSCLKIQIPRINQTYLMTQYNQFQQQIVRMSNQQTTTQHKKIYDDISLEDRKKLIRLIEEQMWTIRAAAQEVNIKMCTAKHILYLYRKTGKIYRKRGELPPEYSPPNPSEQVPKQQQIPIVCFVPFIFFFPEGQIQPLSNQSEQVKIQ